jgi:hypothetical protein
VGLATLDAHFRNWTFAKNVIVNGRAAAYPAENYFVASVAAVGFDSVVPGSCRLSAESPFKNAGTDGRDVGATLSSPMWAQAVTVR